MKPQIPTTPAYPYPTQWERTASTRDGVPFGIRPICAGDEGLEHQFIVRLSPESRYKRMMCAMKEPSADLLHQLVHVDYEHDMAFIALIGTSPNEEIIGVARYCQDKNGPNYEFAVAVADAWQGRGVGATLTRLLFEYAHEQRIGKIHGEIFADNAQMIDLVHWLGMQTRICPEDTGLIEASLEA